MHDPQRVQARGCCRYFLVVLCVVLALLTGCAGQKRVAPPPAKPAAKGKTSTVPAAKVRRPSVVRPTPEGRYIKAVPPVEQRPVVKKPSAEPRPAYKEQPIEERDLETPVGQEHPPASRPPEEERFGARPSGEEPEARAVPPAEEPPAAAEPPATKRSPATAEPPAGETPVVSEPPADYKPVTGKAAAIYTQAEEEMQAGRYSAAEMLLERALRIEPRNAHYWYILGLAKFRQKQYAQTVQFCLKVESLAGSQPGLIARNQVLLTQAKKAAGMK